MNFTRHSEPNKKKYFLPLVIEETNKVFIFTNKEIEIFSLEAALKGDYIEPFLMVFYKGDIDFSEVVQQELNGKLLGKNTIYWLDNFSQSTISKASFISFKSINIEQSGVKLSIGSNNWGIEIKNGSVGGVLTYNSLVETINIKPSSANGFNSEIHKTRVSIKEIKISLSNKADIIDDHTFKSKRNFGAVCFKISKNGFNELPQPVSPYFIDNINSPGNPRSVITSYFDKTSFRENVELFFSFKPFKSISNSIDENSSFIETVITSPTKTNFIDENASQYYVNGSIENKTVLVSRISSIECSPGHEESRDYFVIPQDDETLELESIQAKSQHFLIGYSGTESLTLTKNKKVNLKFRENNNVSIDRSNGSLLPLGNSESKTSFLIIDSPNYNLDSEKSPLFNNQINGLSSNISLDGDIKGSEVAYSPVNIFTIANPPALPIIPTLSFAGNPDLIELESVFSKMRLRELRKNGTVPVTGLLESDKKYVTPQGFLREGNTIEFVKSNGTFAVENVTLNSDFNLSLSKEDVFFVLEPSMLKSKTEKVSVKFKIGGSEFSVESKAFNDLSSEGAKDTYIIFKFSRHSFFDLLSEPTKWSNYNSYKPKDYISIIDSIKSKIAFPDNDDYKYFNNTISKDPNWNGVVILNIPITDQMPAVFNGLAASQDTESKTNPNNPANSENKLQLKTGLKFQYVAFPVNRTKIEGGVINIASTSFYGIIDYDLLNKPDKSKSEDYERVTNHFPTNKKDIKNYKFILSKLLIRFENSQIRNFKSFAFLQLPDLFDNKVEFGTFSLSHPNMDGDLKANLIRLEGNYQKNKAGNDEFNFSTQSGLRINFEDDNILKSVTLSKLGFSYSRGTDEFRFDIDANADLASWSKSDFFSIEKLEFQNIGFKFKLDKIKFPTLKFDLSRLLVFPKINFDGKGFLSSFPIKFSSFQNFQLKLKTENLPTGPKFSFELPDFDFFGLEFNPPTFDFSPPWNINSPLPNLFSFIFDFDLGTLGDLGGLKALKGQILVGWSFKGGFALGFKLEGPSSDGLHLDLFGAVKLDVDQVNLCSFNKTVTGKVLKSYFLRLVNARLTVFGKEIPDPKDFDFNGIIYANPFDKEKNKTAWFIAATKKNDDNPIIDKLILGIGQRVGTKDVAEIKSVNDGIEKIIEVFQTKIEKCTDGVSVEPILTFSNPDRNWLIASEAILPADWPIELKFIFNDPVLYGIYLGFKGEFLKGFSVDILYKKLSESLGVYSSEIQLPDELRNQEIGGAFLKLPNIGIEIYTNGDWKVDIGFPRNGNDWSRSGFLQLRTAPPFVGFFGFYIMMSKVASLTLFKGYIDDTYSQEKLQIIQAGFAMRVGIGFYFDKGILYVGASITVYGILEGAFAFEKQKGLAQLFPDHFAVLGRMGAIAELVGYVDFGIIKASVYISLRAEFGMLMVYIGNDHTKKEGGGLLKQGIQPVLVYIEGEVIVRVSIKIGCVKIRLSFRKLIRFEYTIGGGSSSGNSLMGFTPLALPAFTDEESVISIPIEIKGIKEIPMMYLPAFSKVNEKEKVIIDGKEKVVDVESLKLIHSFMIPFFGKSTEKNETGEVVKIIPSDKNILKDKIIKPFFDELAAKLESNEIIEPRKYETIRSVLVTGYGHKLAKDPVTNEDIKTKVKVDISISGYVPTFIRGINSGDETVVNEILKKQFLFNKDNSEHKPHDAQDNSIEGKYNKELLMIPAPISGKIKIIESGKPDVITTNEAGFKLKLEGLVSGLPADGSHIKEIKDYDDVTLEFIEKFYDDYKTQFLERKNKIAPAFALTENKDIREEVIIPEFFKLIGLLTLEAFQSDTNPKNKDTGEWNPNILLNENGDFLVDGKPIDEPWKTNDAIPQIVGQLNYFYNSGLRLPFEENNDQTRSIYSILQQEVTVKPIAAPDLNNIIVDFNGIDLTSDVFRDDAAKNAMLTFINGINRFDVNELKKKLITKDNDYNPTDNPIQFTKPYRLMPVSLAVQNGKLGIESDFRFFEIPRKLSQHSSGKTKYSFEVNYAKYENDTIEFSTNRVNTPKLIGLDKCLNVEVKVKKHSDRILEIVNVFADDLNLMNALHGDDYPIQNIDFYYKSEASPEDQEADLALLKLQNKYVTILKTNLSPRTSPPIFKEVGFQFDEEEKIEYWEDSNVNTVNFIRLVWEALTTNNGGYYLILDVDKKFPNDANGNEIIAGSIIISFAGDNIKTPAYFNALKIAAKPSTTLDNTEMLNNLKANTHYLFIDSLKLSNEKVSDELVLEYQPTIPAHTVGFDVYRESKEDEGIYHNYLPLEFSLKNGNGEEVLSRDKVLPIMPSSFKDAGGLDVKDKVKYNHLTPLVTQSSYKDAAGNLLDPLGRNLDRYSAVGQKYNLSINLRDVFGNRTNPDDKFLATAPYTHQYFDKLVPIESWPLIRFSYWFKKTDANNLVFDISCTCNILEILDLAGIEKNKIISPSNPNDIKYEYKYQLGKEITKREDVIKLQEVVPGILNNLYTIYAQLNDDKTVASINEVPVDEQKKNWKITVRDLFEKLEKLIKNEGGKYRMPEKPVVVPKDYSVEISTAFKLKTPLKIEIGLNRLESSLIHSNDKDLLESNIWEYSLTKEVKTIVTASNLKDKDNKSKLTDLNDAIRGTDKKYCLGISSEITQDSNNKETKSDKVIFIINEDKLSLLQANVKGDKSFADSCYFGIKPISNSLWSGNYGLRSEEVKSSFSNIDLDKSLRIVLEKIDSFLHASTFPKEIFDATESKLIKDIYNRLLKGKKLLVNEKLRNKLAWVMNKAELSDPQKLEFRDLLLNNLTNFYAYDGMVKTEFKGIELLKYKVNTDPFDLTKSEERTHRLNVNLKSDKYNLVSSKIGDEKYGNEWYILFDQKDEVIDNINFDVHPEITHIEYDIRDVEGSEDIKQSTWIQLINPITLKENYSVKNWQKITRKFPDKPVIIKHEATQMYKDGAIEVRNWNENKIGLWNYKLEIKESNYEHNDIIHVDLEIETATDKSAFAEKEPKFEGFIAYWASEFSMSVIDIVKFPKGFIDLLIKFVEDIERQFNQPVGLMDDDNDKDKIVYPFSMKKVKDTEHPNAMIWKISKPAGSPLIVKSLDGKDVTKTPIVTIGPFDIFKNEKRIISVLPNVKVKRNFSEKINNPDFVYETDTVMPESPATPQLQYHLPIRIEDGKNMKPIFEKIAELNLPYKSTAKLLIYTADLDKKREEMVPVIPVRQMEFKPGGKPVIKAKDSMGIEKEITIDEMFEKYSNGYPSISLTIYNDDKGNELPIFMASNIYKQKQ
jgi:hypothetical protein